MLIFFLSAIMSQTYVVNDQSENPY